MRYKKNEMKTRKKNNTYTNSHIYLYIEICNFLCLSHALSIRKHVRHSDAVTACVTNPNIYSVIIYSLIGCTSCNQKLSEHARRPRRDCVRAAFRFSNQLQLRHKGQIIVIFQNTIRTLFFSAVSHCIPFGSHSLIPSFYFHSSIEREREKKKHTSTTFA